MSPTSLHVRIPTPALHHIFGQSVQIFMKKGSGLNTKNHQIRLDFGSGFPTDSQGSSSVRRCRVLPLLPLTDGVTSSLNLSAASGKCHRS